MLSATGGDFTVERRGSLAYVGKRLRESWQWYLLLLPALIYLIIFAYAPMYGLQIAFKNFKPIRGIWGSEWVGLKYFQQFVNSYQFWKLLKNTLTLSLYSIVANFPAPILLALMLNQLRSEKYKKLVQTVTYMPHFISMVVLVGMINVLLSSSSGLYGNLMRLFGVSNPPNLFANKNLFSTLYVFSGVWQNMGWNSIIYMAALSGIDPTLYEAGRVDGASRWQMLWRITLPCLAPTICIMLILQCGRLMSLGYEKIYLMQNDLNIAASEVISTYVYKSGLINAEYSFSTAIGLFNSVINCILLFTVNFITGKLSDTRIF